MSLQAGALRALPELDRETAEDLRRRQQSHDHASTSDPDDRLFRPQREPSTLISQQEGLERQHVLLRPPKLDKGRAGSAMADVSSSASIWDSYDADEEAAVLAISSSPGIEFRAQDSELSKDRQSNSRGGQAQEVQLGQAATDQISSSQSRQHGSSKSSSRGLQDGGLTSWEGDSSTDSTVEPLTRRTEEDMYPDLPLFM